MRDPQYHHVVDVVPTVLEALGVEAPRSYRGIDQMPVHGVSMLYSFDAPEAPTRRTSQYYELCGDRAVWHGGWKAVARHEKGTDFEADRWELYHHWVVIELGGDGTADAAGEYRSAMAEE